MEAKLITRALEAYLKSKCKDFKGFLICKESLEPTRLNAYKKYLVEIYNHFERDNKLIFTLSVTDRVLDEDKDKFKERYSYVLLEQIFLKLGEIENEVI